MNRRADPALVVWLILVLAVAGGLAAGAAGLLPIVTAP